MSTFTENLRSRSSWRNWKGPSRRGSGFACFTCTPSGIDEELLDQVMESPRILNYLDIPIQHADPGVLRAMNREIPPERLLDIFKRIRAGNPDFALRTTVMVGHPGEDEKAFDALLGFISEIHFDRLGAFEFSPEEGTVSASLGGKVPARVKKKRLERLMSLQEELSLERQSRLVGKELTVLVESIEKGEDLAFGRSYREAPEVDGIVEIRGGGDLAPGSFSTVLVREALEHDLVAEVKADGV